MVSPGTFESWCNKHGGEFFENQYRIDDESYTDRRCLLNGRSQLFWDEKKEQVTARGEKKTIMTDHESVALSEDGDLVFVGAKKPISSATGDYVFSADYGHGKITDRS